jgi:addiction module HigA family antidote
MISGVFALSGETATFTRSKSWTIIKEREMAKKLKPIHPGEILREEFMKPLGLSMNRMALDLRVPVTRIADIVNERRGITADTALRFARYFKNSAAFWMNLQSRYDLEVAEDEIADQVERDVRPLESATVR